MADEKFSEFTDASLDETVGLASGDNAKMPTPFQKVGTNVSLKTITDKVGIGTASPAVELDIVGKTQMKIDADDYIVLRDDLDNIIGTVTNAGDASYLSQGSDGSNTTEYRSGQIKFEGSTVVTISSAGISAPNLTASTYTPTLTNTTNVTSSTPRLSSWSRVGNIVTVYGSLDVTTTLAVATEVQITLPVASNLATAFDLNGTGQASSAIATNAVLLGDATTDRARLTFIGLSVGGAGTIYYSFQYQVL